MPVWDTIIEDMQTDAAARLMSEPFFSNIVVLEDAKGVNESDVQSALKFAVKQTGKKSGAVVRALMPSLVNAEGEAPGPDLKALLQFEVITLPLINRSATKGTGKSAERIAANVLNTLHRYFSGLSRATLIAADRPIVPMEGLEGEVNYLVRLEGHLVLARRNKVATPHAESAGSLATLTCVTPGSTIWYTTDGSYPGPENPTATEYTAPFAITIGGQIRYGAIKNADWIPSDTGYYAIVAEVIGTGIEGEALGTGEDNTVLGTGEAALEDFP